MTATRKRLALAAAADVAEARSLDLTTADLAALLAAAAPYLDGRRHGDHAGYAAHLRRGEKPCAECRAGERVYRRNMAAKKRAAQDAAVCGLPHRTYPGSVCAEPAGHDKPPRPSPHAAVLVIGGRECGSVAWDTDTNDRKEKA